MNAISTNKPAITLDPRTYARGLGCVHCGLCLPACPTYTETGNEADSPRGRIQLMLGLADGRIEATDSVRKHLDQCLDCRACETACPSAVVYHELIEETRPQLPGSSSSAASSPFMKWVFFHIMTKPARLRLAMIPARFIRKFGLSNFFPTKLRKMLQMAPASGKLWPGPLPALTKARQLDGLVKTPRRTVAFFPTCIGSVVYDDVNRKAIELLSACGADVVVRPLQACCGAIHHHNGASSTAQDLARQNIDVMIPTAGALPDFITTAVAGCGAMLKDYPHLLRDDTRYHARAIEFSKRMRDVSEVILELGLPRMKHHVNMTITYHDACHLIHAQQVASAPRTLLSSVPGLKMVALPESDTCCGAAGTYNLTQPEMASALAQRKLKNIASTGAGILAAGNVGCAMHLRAAAEQSRQRLDVLHPVQILHQAVFGSK